MPPVTESVAHQALKLAEKNEGDIVAHEKLCAERYGNINDSIREIKGFLKWVGGSAFLIIIGLLGWSLKQQVNANDAAVRAVADTRIELLEQQIRNPQRNTSPR